MIRQRLKQYLDYKDITPYKFYKDLHISNGFLDKEGSIRSDIVEKILSYYNDLDSQWFITGHGEMITEKKDEGQEVKEAVEPYLLKRRKIKIAHPAEIPVYQGFSQAGLITVYSDTKNMETPIGTLNPSLFPGCDHAEKVNGDSMYPIMMNQGYAIGKKIEKRGIIYGEKYGIRTKYGLRVFKYLQKGDSKETIKLVSYNKSIPDQDIPLDDINFCFRILFVINPT